MEKPEILSVKEAAALFRVDAKTIYRWTSMGRIKPMRIGRTVRFRRSQLLLAMERFEFGPPESKRLEWE